MSLLDAGVVVRPVTSGRCGIKIRFDGSRVNVMEVGRSMDKFNELVIGHWVEFDVSELPEVIETLQRFYDEKKEQP